jgi:hypothetical protein
MCTALIGGNPREGLENFASDVPFEKPTVHGLMKIQGTGDGHVCLHVLEASPLQGSVWTDVESVRLTEQLIDLQCPKIDIDA